MAWFAVNTLPHQEARAEINLRRQEFCVFLPRLQRTRRHARRFEKVLTPLFPSYLFVAFDAAIQPWRSINGTFGVRSLIMHNDGPAKVPEGFVENLQSLAGSEAVLDAIEPTLKPGDRVVLVEGPFADCMATLLKVKARERVEVLLNVLGGQFSVWTSRQAVAPAD